MNFINVNRDGDEVKGEGVTLPIPTRYRGGVDGAHASSSPASGPEHLELGDIPNSATIRAKADVVEFLGDEELLHVTVPGHEGDVVAVVSSEHRVKPGDMLDLKLPLEKLHLFDAATGDSLGASRRRAPRPASGGGARLRRAQPLVELASELRRARARTRPAAVRGPNGDSAIAASIVEARPRAIRRASAARRAERPRAGPRRTRGRRPRRGPGTTAPVASGSSRSTVAGQSSG